MIVLQVIYCYGDLVPRHDELFEGKEESAGRWWTMIFVIKVILVVIMMTIVILVISVIRNHIDIIHHVQTDEHIIRNYVKKFKAVLQIVTLLNFLHAGQVRGIF